MPLSSPFLRGVACTDSRLIGCLGSVQAEAKKLQDVLERELGWSFGVSEVGGDSDDEDAPVVVEL